MRLRRLEQRLAMAAQMLDSVSHASHHGPILVSSRSDQPGFSVLELKPGRAVIGRDEACNIQIEDVEVSRRHAELTLEHGTLTIQDLDSLNGTLLNGRFVVHAVLSPGDLVEICSAQFLYLDDSIKE